jgi:sporulation protein YlmC with PRC-barrel domain
MNRITQMTPKWLMISGVLGLSAGIAIGATDEHDMETLGPKSKAPLQTDRDHHAGITKQSEAKKDAGNACHTCAAFREASELIGRQVSNHKGEDLGRIKDLAVDTERETVAFAVIECGLLGMDHYGVPWTAFSQSAESDRLILPIAREELHQQDTISTNWHEMRQNQWVTRTYGLYENLDQWAEADPEAVVVESVYLSRAPSAISRGSEILDADVESSDGKNIGHMEDMLVELATGELSYAILAVPVEGQLTDELYATSMRHVSLDSFSHKKDRLNLEVTQARFHQARNDIDQDWHAVHTDRGPEIAESDEEVWIVYTFSGADRDEGRRMQERRTPRTAEAVDHRISSEKTVRGTITSVLTGGEPTGERGMVKVWLRAFEGELGFHPQSNRAQPGGRPYIAVQLAPEDYLSTQGIELVEGERIQVRGPIVRKNGIATLIAYELHDGAEELTLRSPSGTPEWAPQQAMAK